MNKDTSKRLGQHWLYDKQVLAAVCEMAQIGSEDVVLEIGPGLGTLTTELTRRAKRVIAVEFDAVLATQLKGKIAAGNLQVVETDILKFDLTTLPRDYKVAANIPYYLTSNLLRVLAESPNAPQCMALLVQKEVAERVAAKPGGMSLLSVSVQFYYQPTLGLVVPARLFTPPPKVDSQILGLIRHAAPLFPDVEPKLFFRIVKAGFSARRKKLRSSLSAGLRISKEEAVGMLGKANINPDLRAQALSLEDWSRLYKTIHDRVTYT